MGGALRTGAPAAATGTGRAARGWTARQANGEHPAADAQMAAWRRWQAEDAVRRSTIRFPLGLARHRAPRRHRQLTADMATEHRLLRADRAYVERDGNDDGGGGA